MSDNTLPTGGTTTSTPPPEPAVDNAAFAAMRTALAAQTAKAAALETEKAETAAKLKAFEDASKSELERLTERANEADRLRDENGKYVSATQKLYEDALAGIPEDKRELVAGLSATGNYAERYNALQAATKLMGTAPPPTNVGTGAAPTRGTAPMTQTDLPKTAEEISKLPWETALRSHPVKVPDGFLIKEEPS